ncbi:unnamed protein product [Adineta ricciae]|uniref:Uncharacterized protein n=1 Tax=Adineta ricciae TaxID=249248 RepID=A0A815MX96_ADIRI|nr:unnamed protein product [Adineta ricciae]CAF1429232.1 unnamed protein product [Adineta ricciae]
MSIHSQQSIQVSCRGTMKFIRNFTNLTTVADVIHALLDDLCENEYFSINDCCLYIEQQPHLIPLKMTDYIVEILSQNSPNVRFKLSFKRTSSPSRLAQRKKLLRTPIEQPALINPYERLRMQEILIQKQQELINQLTKTSTRHSRRDEYHHAIQNREEPTRSLSQVRFRLTQTHQEPRISSPSSLTEVKSILKKPSIQRSSSLDRDIDQLISLKPGENSLCTLDDDNLSDKSTTDSCLGSLSSEDGVYHCHALETLV